MRINCLLIFFSIAFYFQVNGQYETHECLYQKAFEWELESSYDAYYSADSLINEWTNINQNNFSYQYRYQYNGDQLDTMKVFQAYDPGNINWVLYRTVSYEYDQDLVTSYKEDYVNILPDTKINYFYNSDDLNDSTLIERRTDGVNWENFKFQLRSYNDSFLSELEQHVWTGDAWQKDRKWTYTYNGQGFKLTTNQFNWVDSIGVWSLQNLVINEYQNDQVVSVLKLDGNNDTTSFRGISYTDDLIQVDSTVYFTDTLDFVNEKITYEYGNDGWLVRTTERFNPTSGNLEANLQERNVYNNGELIETNTYRYENSHWIEVSKYNYFCDLSLEVATQVHSSIDVPNPIIAPFVLDEAQSVRVYSIAGQEVLSIQKSQWVDLSLLPDGVYVLQIGNEYFIRVKK